MRLARTSFLTLAGVAALAIPSLGSAQACIGVPIPDASFGIAGHFQTTEGANGYGGSLTANLAGPFSVQGRYTLLDMDDIEENANSFGGTAAYEIPNISFSVCPFVGLDYTKWSATDPDFGVEVDVSETVIPIGLGLGYTFAASPTIGLTVYGMPQFMHIRGKLTASAGGEEESFEDDSNEFGADIGFRLGTSSLFGGAGVMFTSIEESDPVFTVAIGIAVGGPR